VSDSGSDHEEDPVEKKDEAAVAHQDKAKDQDDKEDEGEKEEEGRAIKKAKI
jgi:hypothetical protein